MVDSFPIPFGRYTLVERLAMGGMAELFLATAPGEHGFQKKVVIKRLLPHLAREPVYTAMFIDEAKLTAALVHPKIAQTHELGRYDNDLFIAMEFVDGIDVLALLREHAWQRRRIPVEQAVWICHEVLDALDFAHNLTDERGESLSIVHRDISPSNVLLSRRGDVKLVDFGIARATAAGRHHRTKSGTLKGKYGYMSPEQVTEQPIDARSDLFSVGVVLAEMLCGRRLFAATAEIDVLLMVRDARLTRLDQFGGHIPPALDLILRKILRKEPDERWSSAAELRDTLAEWLFQERYRVGPRQIAELVESFHETAWRRRRESVAKAAAAVAAADQSQLSAAASLTPEPVTPASLAEEPVPIVMPPRVSPLLAFELELELEPAAAASSAEPQGYDGSRRRRASSTDGLPVMTIEPQAELMYLDLASDLADLGVVSASAPERLMETGPVGLIEDSVDLDLADLTDPPQERPRVDLEAPGVRALQAARGAAIEPRARGSGSSPALEPARGYVGSNPALEPTRIPGSSPAIKRAAVSNPALEPMRGPSSSAGIEVPRSQPSSPAILRGAAPGPAPLTLDDDDDDDDLGLGPAGPPRSSDQVATGPTTTSGPSSAASGAHRVPGMRTRTPEQVPTTRPPARTSPPDLDPPARPSDPAYAPPRGSDPGYPARGSKPDLAVNDLDPPVPPPSRGGPPTPPSGVAPTAHSGRVSQPIMSAAARNRAISTSPPVDTAASARRPTLRPEPAGARAFLGDEIDALADDIDAAVQQLQVPVPVDDDPSVRISMIDPPMPPRTPTHDFDDSTNGGRRRSSRMPAVPEVPPSSRSGESGPISEPGVPTVRGDFAVIPPMTVLFRLAAAGATGLLTAQVGGIRKEIFVRGGIAEYVTSNMASELLGNYLVARGALSSGELAMALAMMPHYGGKLGDTLVGLGLLKPLEVFRYLNHQVREKLIDVCTWTKGSYAWFDGRTNQRNAFPIDLNPFEVLGAGAMAVRDDVVAAWLQHVGTARAVRVRARPTIELDRFEIPGLPSLFDKADGTRTVRDLVTEAVEPPQQRRIARLLRLLVQCELVRTDGG